MAGTPGVGSTGLSTLVGSPTFEAMPHVDPVVRNLQTQRFREMSAERKLQLADELLALARELKESSLRKLHPELSEAPLRARVTELLRDAGSAMNGQGSPALD